MSSYDFCNFKLKDTVSHSVSVVVLGQALEAPPTSHKLQAHQVSKTCCNGHSSPKVVGSSSL